MNNSKVRQQDPPPDDGFESDQEARADQSSTLPLLPGTPHEREEEEERLVLRLTPAEELRTAKLSLYPDIALGWRPKFKLPKPIPIVFEDAITDRLHKLRPPSVVVFLGSRPASTYPMHEGREYEFPYIHQRRPQCLPRQPFQGMRPDCHSRLEFNSDFEGGNLDAVVQVGQYQFDLFPRVDTNTRGHRQWFNFKVRAREQCSVKFSIWGIKADSLYSRGMRPFARVGQGSWGQVGEGVSFERRALLYPNNEQLFQYDCYQRDKQYYRLSFQYKFGLQPVQFAYCVPYQYSRVLKLVEDIRGLPSVSVERLTLSLSGLPVNLVTLTSQDSAQRKRCVLITGRAHPGESNGSWMMEGLLKALTEHSAEAEFLLKHVQLKVVPMLNPDGVVAGNFRTGLTGRDFNRQFLSPDEELHPEVHATGELAGKLAKEFGKDLHMFLDLHGHSLKKNVFMYGPEFPITHRGYYQSKVFPRLLGARTQMFRFYSCIFRLAPSKFGTARGVMLRRFKIPYCYTVEASNGFYHSREMMRDFQFGEPQYLKMGRTLVLALHDYFQALLSHQELSRRRLLFRNKRLMARRQRSKDITSFEKGELNEVVNQIRQEQHQPRARASDDQLSEGSSDCSGASQDLSPEKSHQLFQQIKGLQVCALAPEKQSLRQVRKRGEQEVRPTGKQSQVASPVQRTSSLFQSKNEVRKQRGIFSEYKRPVVEPVNFSFGSRLKAEEEGREMSTTYGGPYVKSHRAFINSISPVRTRMAKEREARMYSLLFKR